MKKNEEYITSIIDNGFQGEGIAKIDDITVFVPNCIKGEKVKLKILKEKNNIAYGKVIEVIERSENRVDGSIDCETFFKCGGCTLRHMKNNYTIEMKKNAVQTTKKKALNKDIIVDEVIKMDNPFNYRNKLQYPIGIDKNGNYKMGVYTSRTHDIVETQNCFIQNELIQKIANDIFAFIKQERIVVYNEKDNTGGIRHLIIRIGKKTNEVLVTIVTNTEKIGKEKELVSYITNKYSEIKTIVKNVNNKNTNVILGNKNIVLYGNGYIYDYIGEFKFKISAMSFYQVNPVQTEKLYAKAIEYADLSGDEIVFDLYCGIGTIGICASKKIKKLYGIETISEAIEDAKENAKLNNLDNAEFFVGDVEKTLPEFIEKNNINPDIVFLDPPRKGCDKKAIDALLQIKPKKIVYISCNPATLARDLKLLSEKYEIRKVAICDMFPYTSHIECVTVLCLKEKI